MTALLEPLTVATATASGAAFAQGAQVVDWTPRGTGRVLWLSPRARREVGAAIRGGTPVCFPWFGPGRFGDRTPQHGFARTSTWRSLEAPAGTLAFELRPADLTDEARALWPHDFATRLTATFAADLTIELAVENPSDQPLDIEAALHTYLAVGDVRRVEIHGLEGAQYVDKTADGEIRTQEGPVRFDGETDRVYASVAGVDVIDPVLGRTLHIASEGATKTVVWNPGEEKGTALADVEGWSDFCCVEAANALDGCVTIAPGATHTLTQRIAIR